MKDFTIAQAAKWVAREFVIANKAARNSKLARIAEEKMLLEVNLGLPISAMAHKLLVKKLEESLAG